MTNDPFSRAWKCGFKSVCLYGDAAHPACEAIDAVGYNLMFVHNNKKRKCPYGMQVGDSEICTCPTHFCLHERKLQSESNHGFSYSDKNGQSPLGNTNS